MRKYFIFLIVSSLLVSSCKKNIENPGNEAEPNSVSTYEQNEIVGQSAGSSTSSNGSSRVLTLSMKSDRTLKKGKTFIFYMTVKKGNDPVKNYPVAIDDPIQGMCLEVNTNSKGEIEYRSKIPSYTEPDFYQYRFYIKNATPILSAVAVYDESPGKKFSQVKVDLKSELQNKVNSKTLLFSERAKDIGESNSTDILNSTFGQDLYKETFNNPANNVIMAVTAISCPLTLVFPPAGGVCIASARLTFSHLTETTFKVIAKRAIDRTNLSSSDKNKWKTLIDAAFVAKSIANFKIDQSLMPITVTNGVAVAWDFKNVVIDPYKNSNGTFKGFNLTGEIKNGPNKGEMCVMSIVAR